MDQESLKNKLLEQYLRQQQGVQRTNTSSQQHHASPSQASTSSAYEIVKVNPDEMSNITLEEFKEYVKKWIELDNVIKKGQEAIRERKQVRDKLSLIISKFMCKYDIEDLNTKEGKIRCKVTQAKAPLSQKVIKQKITDYFQSSDKTLQAADVIQKIYNERETVQKVSLRRLKIS
jgi:hypothetical protein